jgi:hypothetical protein
MTSLRLAAMPVFNAAEMLAPCASIIRTAGTGWRDAYALITAMVSSVDPPSTMTTSRAG